VNKDEYILNNTLHKIVFTTCTRSS